MIKLQRNGGSHYPVYNIIILHKKSRIKKGRKLDCIGFYNPNYNNRMLFFNSVKLYFWVKKGLKFTQNSRNYFIKFLL